ncbi:Tpr repeat protein, partial [Globisporangium splendens]
METLQQQLQQLTPEQVRQLLDASGHAQLLQQQSDQQSASEQQQQTPQERAAAVQQQVEQAKQRGNERFREKAYLDAVKEYSICIDLEPRNAVCLSNRAAAHLKLCDYQGAIEDCSKAIEIAPSIKPLMRRATAHIELQQFDEAVQDLKTALQFEPHNKECISKLSSIASRLRRSSQSDPFSAINRRAFVQAALVVATRNGWTPIAVKGNPAPPALNGHTLFCASDQKIYLFGGRSTRDQEAHVYVLDASDFSWEYVSMSGASPPTPRAWHTVCSIHEATSTMCVYGGISSQGEDPQVHLLTFANQHRLDWLPVSSVEGNIPAPRSGHTATGVNIPIEDHVVGTHDVCIFGGRTKKGVSSDVYTLHAARCTNDGVGQHSFALTWEQVPQVGPWPSGRDGHTMCLLSNSSKLVLFGGNGQKNEDKMNDTWVLDTATGTWDELICGGDIPPPRSYHTAHIIGSYMFVIGGRMQDTEDSNVYMLDIDQFCCLGVECREWFRVPIPENAALGARAWHASILTEDFRVFLLGGGTFTGPRKDAAILNLSQFAAFCDHA